MKAVFCPDCQGRAPSPASIRQNRSMTLSYASVFAGRSESDIYHDALVAAINGNHQWLDTLIEALLTGAIVLRAAHANSPVTIYVSDEGRPSWLELKSDWTLSRILMLAVGNQCNCCGLPTFGQVSPRAKELLDRSIELFSQLPFPRPLDQLLHDAASLIGDPAAVNVIQKAGVSDEVLYPTRLHAAGTPVLAFVEAVLATNAHVAAALLASATSAQIYYFVRAPLPGSDRSASRLQRVERDAFFAALHVGLTVEPETVGIFVAAVTQRIAEGAKAGEVGHSGAQRDWIEFRVRLLAQHLLMVTRTGQFASAAAVEALALGQDAASFRQEPGSDSLFLRMKDFALKRRTQRWDYVAHESLSDEKIYLEPEAHLYYAATRSQCDEAMDLCLPIAMDAEYAELAPSRRDIPTAEWLEDARANAPMVEHQSPGHPLGPP